MIVGLDISLIISIIYPTINARLPATLTNLSNELGHHLAGK